MGCGLIFEVTQLPNNLCFVFSSTASSHTSMGVKKLAVFLLVLYLCLEGGWAKENRSKKGKKKGKPIFCPS